MTTTRRVIAAVTAALAVAGTGAAAAATAPGSSAAHPAALPSVSAAAAAGRPAAPHRGSGVRVANRPVAPAALGGALLAGGAVRLSDSGSVTVNVAAGTYRLRASVRPDNLRFAVARLSVDGRSVTFAGVGGAGWSDLTAIAHLHPGAVITVSATPPPGTGLVSVPLDLAALDTTPVAPAYTVAGTAILDPSGTPVVLRGVNKNSLELSATGYMLNDAQLDLMAAWGADSVRVQVSDVFWLASSCQYDPGYAARVRAYVTAVTARGMIADLDLHTSAPGTGCVSGVPRQQKMADAAAVTFWSQAAALFGSNPRVFFDLYNEPHDISYDTWRDGGTVDGWQAAGMAQMYAAVRAAGATNPVLVSGDNWSADLTAAVVRPMIGYGIVYAAHLYQGDTCRALVTDASVASWTVPASAYPVVLTEFGTDCGTPDFVASVISYAEAHGLGWEAFAWNAGGPTAWSLLADWAGHPSPVGAAVRVALTAAPPAPSAPSATA